jgi:tetratricopeptide (TPR) repeat protein
VGRDQSIRISPPLSQPRHITVFLSSPGDVADERALARRTLESLENQPFIRGRATLRVVAWDNPGAKTPLLANLSPQEAINRQLLRPGQCDIAVVVLWSRLGTPLGEEYRKPNGEAYRSGTEWEFEDAARNPATSILMYRRTEPVRVDLDDPDYDDKRRQYEAVKQFFAERMRRGSAGARGFVTYESPSEFEARFATDIRSVLEMMLERAPESEEVARAPAREAIWHGSPYPGLRALSQRDAPLFFGRGAETDQLLAHLRTSPTHFLGVVGASGSGKSSLVGAGLLPRLADGAIDGSRSWRSIRMSPSQADRDPFMSLTRQLAALPAPSQTAERMRDEMRADPRETGDIAVTVLPPEQPSAELVVFIDQLEELFTVVPVEVRQPFDTAIGAMAAHRRIRVIATLRSDFFASAANYPQLAALLQHSHFLLLPPGWRALTEMVVKPAERAGIEFEPGLADRLVADSGIEPGSLPLLAYTLDQLFDAEHDTLLTHATYDELGGIRGAISRRAEGAYTAADAESQAALPRLFRELVAVDRTGIATRQRASRRELGKDPAAARLAEQLVRSRLLIADTHDGVETLEVAHEALFESWPRLKLWLDESRDFLLWRQRLRFSMDLWQRSGRRSEALLSGVFLDEALGWLGKRAQDLSDEERQFIEWTTTETYQLEQAIESARSVIDDCTGELQVTWLASLVVADKPDAVSLTVSDIKDPRRRASALTQLCESLAAAGIRLMPIVDAAFQAISQAPQIAARVRLGTRMARLMVQSGETDRARAFLKVTSAEYGYADLDMLMALAAELAVAGLADEAEAVRHYVAAEIGTRPFSERHDCAILMARLGYVEDAAAIVNDAEGSWPEPWAEEIADSFFRAGDSSTLVARLLAALAPGPRTRAVSRLVARHLDEQDLTAARVLARNVLDETERTRLLHDIAHAYVNVGQLDPALDLAMEMDEPTRSISLLQIGCGWVKAGNAVAAAATIDRITDPAWRLRAFDDAVRTAVGHGDSVAAAALGTALAAWTASLPPGTLVSGQIDVVRILTLTGHLEKAAIAAGLLPDPLQRITALVDIVHAFVARGESENAGVHANALWEQFQGLDKTARDTDLAVAVIVAATLAQRPVRDLVEAQPAGERPALRHLIAGELARRSMARAFEMLEAIGDRTEQATLIATMFSQVLSAGHLADATQAAMRIADLERRIAALGEVSQALILAGDAARAVDVATQASKAAAAAGGDALIAVAREPLTRALIAANRDDEAFELVRQVDDPWLRNSLLSDLATAYAAKGAVDRVIAVCHEDPDAERRLPLLTSALRVLKETSQLQHALTVARLLEQPSDRAKALASVAAEFGRSGGATYAALTATEALEVTQQIETDEWRTAVLTELTHIFVDAGQIDHAELAFQRITDPVWRSSLAADVAGALARAGQHERAVVVARQPPDPSWRIEALVRVAHHLIRAGKVDEAAPVAGLAVNAIEEISDYGERGRSYARLAKILSRVGQFAAARRAADRCREPAERLAAYAAMLVGTVLRPSPALLAQFERLDVNPMIDILTEMDGR